MSLSTQTETVEVVAAGGSATVNTQTQELSQLVNTTQMSQLPSLTRNPYDFVALSGNVSSGDLTSNGGTPNPTATYRTRISRPMASGTPSTGSGKLARKSFLDGVENIGVFSLVAGQHVPVDSIQEFSIITNNFDSQYGRASGGVVNVDTKTGTNRFTAPLLSSTAFPLIPPIPLATTPTIPRKASTLATSLGTPSAVRSRRTSFSLFETRNLPVSEAAPTRPRKSSIPLSSAMLPANIQAYFTKFGTGAFPPPAQ